MYGFFRVKIKCIVSTQIELPNELSYVMIVSRWLLSCNGILSWCHYFPISTSYESSCENGSRVFIITFEISLHAHLRNVLKNDNKGNNFFNMTLKTIITFEFSLQRRNFFCIGFSKPWSSLPLRMRWCDSCPQHETWQLAMTFEFTFVASAWLVNFQSGPTYPTRRGKSLETPSQCLWITDPQCRLARPLSRGVTTTETSKPQVVTSGSDTTKGFHCKTARQQKSSTDDHHVRKQFIWQFSLCGIWSWLILILKTRHRN